MGTSGSEGGQQKPTSREAGKALLPDPFTYLSPGEGWLYLCAVRDGCSVRVVGWVVGWAVGWAVEDHRTDLVEAALRAVTLRGRAARQSHLPCRPRHPGSTPPSRSLRPAPMG